MALEMRTECERCHAPLPPDAPSTGKAYICSYECTFCQQCFTQLAGICPNCGGELAPRPTRIVEP